MQIDFELIFKYMVASGGIAGLAGIIMGFLTRKKVQDKLQADIDEKKALAKKIEEEVDKIKADSVHVIEQAAAGIVEQYIRANDFLRTECVSLRERVDKLSGIVDENTSCQKDLRGRVAELEIENGRLKARAVELEVKVGELQTENKRLRQESDNAKSVIS